jgi:hypothetical protein
MYPQQAGGCSFNVRKGLYTVSFHTLDQDDANPWTIDAQMSPTEKQ